MGNISSTERFKIVMDILYKADLSNNTINHTIFNELKDDELIDENKVNEVLEKIKAYEDRIENNPNRYSEEIMQALRQRKGLDRYDISIDEELNKIEPDEAFHEVVNWNGLRCDYDYVIKGWIEDIYKVKLGK